MSTFDCTHSSLSLTPDVLLTKPINLPILAQPDHSLSHSVIHSLVTLTPRTKREREHKARERQSPGPAKYKLSHNIENTANIDKTTLASTVYYRLHMTQCQLQLQRTLQTEDRKTFYLPSCIRRVQVVIHSLAIHYGS